MAEHFSQKLRRILDAPMSRKGILYWVTFPVLMIISALWAWIASRRRISGYADFSSINELPNDLKVICIGNILIGGTGKSPIVRAIAEKHLNAGHCVAIGSRGINADPIVIDSLKYQYQDLQLLSDENREHFELLRFKYPHAQFFIYQNKNRLNSLLDFIKIKNLYHKNKSSIFILDDGLQHFACPRHMNICVCDSSVDGTALPYALPVGPYREGFGKKSLENILSEFDMCLLPLRQKHSSQSSEVLNHFYVALDKKPISVSYVLKFMQYRTSENGKSEIIDISQEQIAEMNLNGAGIISGIAHPTRFFSDLVQCNQNFKDVSKLSLADHGEFSHIVLEFIENHQTLFLTSKDLFRFCSDDRFIKSILGKTIYGCYLEYDIKFLDV